MVFWDSNLTFDITDVMNFRNICDSAKIAQKFQDRNYLQMPQVTHTEIQKVSKIVISNINKIFSVREREIKVYTILC